MKNTAQPTMFSESHANKKRARLNKPLVTLVRLSSKPPEPVALDVQNSLQSALTRVYSNKMVKWNVGIYPTITSSRALLIFLSKIIRRQQTYKKIEMLIDLRLNKKKHHPVANTTLSLRSVAQISRYMPISSTGIFNMTDDVTMEYAHHLAFNTGEKSFRWGKSNFRLKSAKFVKQTQFSQQA